MEQRYIGHEDQLLKARRVMFRDGGKTTKMKKILPWSNCDCFSKRYIIVQRTSEIMTFCLKCHSSTHTETLMISGDFLLVCIIRPEYIQ